MATLDNFLQNVITQDTRKRIQAHQDLVPYLRDPHSSLACTEIDEFIGGLVGWVNCSNYKISLNGLEVLCFMVNRMGEDFRPYVNSVLPAVIDRLGDSKDQVRDQAQQLLLKLMMPASSPQFVFERLMSAFTHKLWHVREEVLFCLQNTINTYGARSLQLSKVVPSICKLLYDQNSQVRETAINSLAEIYRHVGEKVRQDLAKKGIQPQRLNQIYAKFDEVKYSGNMLATADFAREEEITMHALHWNRTKRHIIPRSLARSYIRVQNNIELLRKDLEEAMESQVRIFTDMDVASFGDFIKGNC